MNFSDALKMGSVFVDAIKLIEKMLDSGAVDAARAAVRALIDGSTGAQTPQEILARIEALHADLAKNDAAADAKLKAKFPG